jgi:hypothetical protein
MSRLWCGEAAQAGGRLRESRFLVSETSPLPLLDEKLYSSTIMRSLRRTTSVILLERAWVLAFSLLMSTVEGGGCFVKLSDRICQPRAGRFRGGTEPADQLQIRRFNGFSTSVSFESCATEGREGKTRKHIVTLTGWWYRIP